MHEARDVDAGFGAPIGPSQRIGTLRRSPASSWVIIRPCRIGVTSTEPPVGALGKIGIGEELFPVDLPGKFSSLAPKLARDITPVYPARGRPWAGLES
jgi:hypothetical protein